MRVPVRRAFRWALFKNFVKQRLHENFKIPAPWLTKEIIFVCTSFLFFTLWMPCGGRLIHAQSTLWIAPQNLRLRCGLQLWMSAYKERWRQNAVEFKWHSFKRLSHYLKSVQSPQIVKGNNQSWCKRKKAVLRFYQTALSFTSISIFPCEQSRVPFATSMGIQSLLSSISLSYLVFYWQLVFAKRIIFRHDKQTPFAEVFWSIQLYI